MKRIQIQKLLKRIRRITNKGIANIAHMLEPQKTLMLMRQSATKI
jgi:hypothetical protein